MKQHNIGLIIGIIGIVVICTSVLTITNTMLGILIGFGMGLLGCLLINKCRCYK